MAPFQKAGILYSSRGVRGGYGLAPMPAHVTVGDILRVLEGAIVPVPRVSEEGSCAREASGSTRLVWERVRHCLVETLDDIALADLIGQAQVSA